MRCLECKRDISVALHAPRCESTSLFRGKYKPTEGTGGLWVGARAGYDSSRVYEFVDRRERS